MIQPQYNLLPVGIQIGDMEKLNDARRNDSSIQTEGVSTLMQSIDHAIHFDIFTLFPPMFAGPFSESIIKRALEKNLISVALHNIRNYTTDRHHTCDETPYGGGGGMLMKADPIVRSVETVLGQESGWQLSPEDAYINLPEWDSAAAANLPAQTPIILMSPQGRPFTQSIATELSSYPRLALICGRYEGLDERVRTQLITDEIRKGHNILVLIPFVVSPFPMC